MSAIAAAIIFCGAVSRIERDGPLTIFDFTAWMAIGTSLMFAIMGK